MKKRIIVLGLIVLVLVGFFYFKSQSNKQPTLQFAQVKRQDIRSAVSSSGTLTGKDSVNLKFKSAGKLAILMSKWVTR